ncbi:MAG: hypothetical protein ACFBSD_00405 [Paracoccaceae bacterium]
MGAVDQLGPERAEVVAKRRARSVLHRRVVEADPLAAHRSLGVMDRKQLAAVAADVLDIPRSEWQIRQGAGRRFGSALRMASIAKPFFRLSDMDQPTISMLAISVERCPSSLNRIEGIPSAAFA